MPFPDDLLKKSTRANLFLYRHTLNNILLAVYENDSQLTDDARAAITNY